MAAPLSRARQERPTSAMTMMRKHLSQFEVRDVRGLSDRDKKCVGEGSYGVVYEVTVNRVPRIAKQLHRIFMDGENVQEGKKALFEKFAKECELLSILHHPNIVEFVGVHFGKSKEFDVSLIMEKLHFDLSKYLNTHDNAPLFEKLSILLDVSSGLLYLHTRDPPIIHRDLSIGNILLTEQLQAKIADFGLSRVLNIAPNALAHLSKCPGALAYMPPEAIKDEPVYGTALDIFSFGEVCLCVIHQTFAQVFDISNNPNLPWPAALERGEVEILKRKKWFDKMPANQGLRKIVSCCLQDNPAKRPSASQLRDKLIALCIQDWKASSKELICLKQQLPKLIDDATQRQQDNLQQLKTRNADLEGELQESEKKLECISEEKDGLEKQHDLLKQEFVKLSDGTRELSQSLQQLHTNSTAVLAKLKTESDEQTNEATHSILEAKQNGQQTGLMKKSHSVDLFTQSERFGDMPMKNKQWALSSVQIEGPSYRASTANSRAKTLPYKSGGGTTRNGVTRAQQSSTGTRRSTSESDKEIRKAPEKITRQRLQRNSNSPPPRRHSVHLPDGVI